MKRNSLVKFIYIVLIILSQSTFCVLGAKEKIIVGIDKYYPPHEFEEDGVVRGFNVDVLNACAKEMGIDIEWKPMVWERAFESLKKGEINALCMSAEEKRKVYYDFTTQTILDCYLVIFVREDTSGIEGIHDLANHTVAVESQDVAHMKLIGLCPDSIRIPVDSQEEALKLLVSGDAYAFLGNFYTGQYLIHKHRYNNVKIIGERVLVPARVIAVSKGNFKLRDRFDFAIQTIKTNKEYQAIYDKWFGRRVGLPMWLNYVLSIFLTLIGIVAILITWSIILLGVVRRRNKALIRSESNLRSILQAAEEEAFITIDKDNLIKSFSPGAEKILGYNEQEIIGTSIGHLYGSDYLAQLTEIVGQVRESREPIRSETNFTRKSGEEFPAEQIYYPVIDKKGNVKNVLCVANDITARKEMEKKLKEDEERLRTLINYSLVGIYVIDENRKILFTNKILADMVNEAVENLIGKDLIQFIHPEDITMVRERYQKRFAREEAPPRYELRFIRKDGTVGWGEVHSHLVTYEGNPSVFGNIIDITERKNIEAQLRHSQKMESIGTLAGGIAHDFNNVLTGILGNVSMLLLEASPDHPFYTRLKEVEKASERAADLTRQLLGFSRKTTIMPKPINLNSCVEDTVKLFKRTIDPKIAVETSLYPGLWIANADKSQMSQILMNLLVNARDAIEEQVERETREPSLSFVKPEQHKIIIETNNVSINEEYCNAHPDTLKGEFVQIGVTDTGCGMDEKTMERIFDPFFTTKSVDKGTGLGLAMVYGIIKQHGGWINVYSSVGRGSTLKVYIPRISEDEEEDHTIPKDIVVGGKETVLLIEDEEIVRNLGNAVLEKYGYKVILAKDGEEAIDIYAGAWEKREETQFGIDLVIVDLSMPKMSGPEVVDEIMKMNPAQKIILSSGYSINGIAKKLLNKGVKCFVQKPYRSIEFAKTVRDVLDM